MNLFIKNLPDSYNTHYLEMLFNPYGEIVSAKAVYDRITGEHRGIGFVEFATEAEGQSAIDALNGKEIQGKTLVVEKARPKKVNIWS